MSEREEVNVEALMQEIRREILARKAESEGDDVVKNVPVAGERFPAEFYDLMYQAGLTYNQVQTTRFVPPSRIPLIGPVLDWVRLRFHDLALFYANRVAAQQMAVNSHLLRALSILSETLEEEAREE